MSSPVIDAETLSEFFGKAEPFMTESVMASFETRLEQRIHNAGTVLTRIRRAPEKDLKGLWEVVPATRRLSGEERQKHDDLAWSLLRPAVNREAAEVFRILEQLEDSPKWAMEWSTFWLYLADPEQFPWWPRWLYNADNQTGALPLVLADPKGFATGLSQLQTYGQIRAVSEQLSAVIAATHRMTRIEENHRVLLCFSWVYAVYMFTMASWRMTSEFTQVLPPFPRVIEGLLGIKHREGVALEQ